MLAKQPAPEGQGFLRVIKPFMRQPAVHNPQCFALAISCEAQVSSQPDSGREQLWLGCNPVFRSYSRPRSLSPQELPLEPHYSVPTLGII